MYVVPAKRRERMKTLCSTFRSDSGAVFRGFLIECELGEKGSNTKEKEVGAGIQ